MNPIKNIPNTNNKTEEFQKNNFSVSKHSNKLVSLFKKFVYHQDNKSISSILLDIKSGIYEKEINKIRKQLSYGNTDVANELKKKLLSFTPSGTFIEGRNKDKLEAYNQLIILDIDKINDEKLIEIQTISKQIPYTYAHFISPSGKGIKIIVATNSDASNHKLAYSQIATYYEKTLNVNIDSSGSDICRLCFISSDTDCFINDNYKEFELKKEQGTPLPINTKSSINDFETLLLQIENNCIDITENYEVWRNLGFAIADEYGETGRNYYHRISCFHSAYNEVECDKQYSSCLNAGGTGIGIGTFYYQAYKHNIAPVKTKKFQNRETKKLQKDIDIQISTFSEAIENKIPEFLQKAIAPFDSNQEKDMILLGAITCISAGLAKVFGYYDNDRIYPNLFLFVTAAASAGKGKLKFCKRLIQPIHKQIRNQSKIEQGNYEIELMEFNQNKKNSTIPKPEKPPTKMFVIPANNSATGFFQLLNDNEGKGLIFETEADTLANNFKQDYGNYSDGFRNAFHHEQIKYYRRTGDEYVEINSPQLSCVLSGTPKQVLALMPNAENGLFSRFMFYEMPISNKWKNVFASNTNQGLDKYFDNLGNDFFALYNQLLSAKEIEFTYTQNQKDRFNTIFSNLNTFYLNVNSKEYTASIRRLGIIAFRISMVFTALRILETGELQETLECSNEDFESTIEIIKVLAKHSSKVFSSLPIDKKTIKYRTKKETFIDNLPFQFTTKQFYKLASNFNIVTKSAERYLTELTKSEFLIRESHGNYINPSKKELEEPEGMRESAN